MYDCQKDRLYFDHQGNATLIPGLNEYLSAFAYLLTTQLIQSLSHSPARLVIMRVHLVNHRISILAQELVYSGYKKLHGHKMETVFFGPVSAWQNDRGMFNMSGLDRFLVSDDPGPSPSSFTVHDF